MEKDSKDQKEKHIKNYGQQVMSVRIPEGFVLKSTWQVADVRRRLVSASHIIQTGNDLFLANGEVYIMSRMKMEKSVLENGESVYVQNKPMEVDAINQVA